MKSLFKSSAILMLTFAVTTTTFAQEEETEEPEPSFSLSGSVDTYMKYNFADDQSQAPGTAFAGYQGGGFGLGMANIIASYEGEKSGFVADLVFGPRGNQAVFGSTEGSNPIVNQLYVYYNVSDALTLTMGNFNTFLGYEVISPVANFNYSTSYMFSYGPFSHTGIKADIALSDDWSLMLGLLNPTDVTEFNPSDQYMFGAQLGFKGQYINFLSGMGQTQIDFTGGFNLSESFFLGINATDYDSGEDTGFSGVALYPQLTLSESFALGLRFEAFADDSTVFTDPETDNTSITLTGSFTSGNMIFKPEFRLDSASESIFTGTDLDPSDNLASFLIAAIYSF